MSIAIVVEKPYVARRIAPIAKRLFPGKDLHFPVIGPLGLYIPSLPRGMKWAQYPCISPFDPGAFSLRKAGDPGSFNPQVWMGDELSTRLDGIESFNACLRNSERLIAIPDPSPGIHHYQVARTRALGQSAAAGEIRTLYSMDDASIEQALLTGAMEMDLVRHLSDYGRTKQYFDYQFASNSLGVLGKTAKTGRWVSKYQLQALYLAASLETATEGELIEHMSHWKGTGRYSETQGETWLGSPTSRTAILAQLEQHGWVVAVGNEKPKRLAVSAQGKQMLARLHPGCEDSDLPFRLQAWCEKGLDASKPAIDRYILTFFGRQKRFIDTPGYRNAPNSPITP